MFFEYVFVYLVLFFGVHACDYVLDLRQYYFGSFLVQSKFLVQFLLFCVSCQVLFFMVFEPLAFCHMFSSFVGNVGMKGFFISFIVCMFPLVPRLLPSISWTLR